MANITASGVTSQKIDFNTSPSLFPKGPQGDRRLYFEYMLLHRLYDKKIQSSSSVHSSEEEIINYMAMIIDEMHERNLKMPEGYGKHKLDRIAQEWQVKKAGVPINKPASRIFNPDELFKLKGFDFPLSIEAKYDGMRIKIEVSDGIAKFYSEDVGGEFSRQFKHASNDLKGLPNCTLDSEAMLWEGDTPTHRTEIIGYAHRKDYNENNDNNSRFIVFDILSHKGQDLRDKSYKERFAILHSITLKGHVSCISSSDRRIVGSRSEYNHAINKVRNLKYSEGAMIKTLSGSYEKNTIHNKTWVKLKNLYEIDGLVVSRTKLVHSESGSPTGAFKYKLAVGPIDEKCASAIGDRSYEFNGKKYMIIGSTFSTKLVVPKNRILRVAVEELRHEDKDGCTLYTMQKPNVLEYVRERGSSPDSVNVLVRIAGMSLQKSEVEKESGPLPKESYKFKPPCSPCRFVVQVHKPSEETKKEDYVHSIAAETMAELLYSSELGCGYADEALKHPLLKIGIPLLKSQVLKFREHIDVRIQVGKYLTGFTPHPPQNVEGGVWGEFMRRSKAGKQTQAAGKQIQPLAWLDVGKNGWQKLTHAGSSGEHVGLMKTMDSGTVEFGVQRNDLHEYFFHGRILKGRWVLRRLTVGESGAQWYFMKPSGEKPLDPKEHRDSGAVKIG